MVTANLLGGLGNYMFQITAAYSLALENSEELIFNINDCLKVHKPISSYRENILRNVSFIESPLPIKNTHSEPFFHYKKIEQKKNIKLNGYYQSEKYFIKNREKVLDFYSIDDNSMVTINNKYSRILEKNTCSLHVRRGDYLGLSNHHPTCNLGYYNRAIALLPKDTQYLVFSDDIEWCRDVFIDGNFVFINGNTDYIDLWLMSLCKNNIIANSSFSWWGAWLNKNKNKKVIAPKKWFGKAITHNTNDLIPTEWERV